MEHWKEDVLVHYGILGMKWGIRRFQPYSVKPRGSGKSGKEVGKAKYMKEKARETGVIKKGSLVTRVAMTREDPTYGNKKHLSTNKKDERIWEKEIGNVYKKEGADVHVVGYKAVKDLKVAPSYRAGEIMLKEMLSSSNPMVSAMTAMSINESFAEMKRSGMDKPYVREQENGKKLITNPFGLATYNIAMQTYAGLEICKRLVDEGYDAVVDEHGRNTADDPVIVFNPDTNLERVFSKKY